MPLVRSKVQASVETVASKSEHAHVHYVPPSQLKAGDEIVEPTEKQREWVEAQDAKGGGVRRASSGAVAASKPLSKMTKKELLKVAKERGVTGVTASNTKAELLEELGA